MMRKLIIPPLEEPRIGDSSEQPPKSATWLEEQDIVMYEERIREAQRKGEGIDPFSRLSLHATRNRLQRKTTQLEALYSQGYYDKTVANLRKEGWEPATARDLADLILALPYGSPFYLSEWVVMAENIIYTPQGQTLVTSRAYSPIVKNPTQAVACHREKSEIYLEQEIAQALEDRAEEDPEKAIQSGVLLLKNMEKEISVDNTMARGAFGKHPLTRFLYRDLTEEFAGYIYHMVRGRYGEKEGCLSVRLHPQQHSQPFVRSLACGLARVGWISDAPGGEVLYLDDHRHYSIGVRRIPKQ